MAAFTAMDIANFYVQLSNDLPETDITNLKLNKLCYYAQGWCLALLNHPLFDDEIQAWDYGPVIPEVYHTYKVCGKSPIGEPADVFDESRLSTDELNLLIDVFNSYAKYAPSELITMTHADGGPWRKAYQERMNNPIDLDVIKEYFKQSDELKGMQLNITPENVVEYA